MRGDCEFEEYSWTMPLDSISTPGGDQVSASRFVASDVLSRFGLPEPSQLTPLW